MVLHFYFLCDCSKGVRNGYNHGKQGALHCENSHDRRTLGSVTQLGWTARCEVVRTGFTGQGTNPEQLFAARWSACFEGAIAGAARAMQIKLPDDLAIDTEVDLYLVEGEYSLGARMNISIPGVERAIAQQLVDAAEKTCPYSKATRGNIPVSFSLV